MLLPTSLFECIPISDVGKLKPGDTIWLDAEQPSGKVYGYDRADVVEIQDLGTHFRIMFKGPTTEGYMGIKKTETGWHKLHRCTNPAALIELVKVSPLAIETGTVSTISKGSQKYLKSIGKHVVFNF